jgi:hypothetical protein
VRAVKRRWLLVVPVAAALLAGAWRLGGQAAVQKAVVSVVRPRAGVTLRPAPRVEEGAPSTAPDATPAPAPTAPDVEVESFLQEYADEVCLCNDMECVAYVQRSYNRRMGHTTRAKDNDALHASALRVRECVAKISHSG